MISPEHLWPYIIASVLIILAPGPSVLFTIARAVAWGRTIALMTVAGNALGMLVLSAGVAIGLGPILQSSALLYSIVQWAGGFYLIWMGIDAIRHRVIAASDMTDTSGGKPRRLVTLRQGFIVGVLNPKAVVFFAAVLPQFVEPDFGSVTVQLLSLGALFSGLAFVFDGMWGIVAGTAREWLGSHPKRLVTLRIAGGCVMILLGVAILFTTPLPW